MRKCCKFVIVPHLNTREKKSIQLLLKLYRFFEALRKNQMQWKTFIIFPTLPLRCGNDEICNLSKNYLDRSVVVWPVAKWFGIQHTSDVEFDLIKMYFVYSFIILLALGSELCGYVQSCRQLAPVESGSCSRKSNFYGKGLFMI